jgi:uncharacterized membrane protein
LTQDPSPAPPPVAPLRLSVVDRLRAYFIAGVLVTAPIALTLYLVWLFIDLVDRTMRPLIPAHFLPFTVPGVGLVAAIAVLTLIGAVTAGWVGRLWLRLSEGILAKMPVVRGIYSATKQIFETVLASKSNTFREVVMVEFPRRDMWTIAFITGRLDSDLPEFAGEEMLNVYVPTTPNPTSGYLVFVPRRDLVFLSMSVEEGIKLVISGGIVAPPQIRARAPAKEPELTA